jgi:hypothetical protein
MVVLVVLMREANSFGTASLPITVQSTSSSLNYQDDVVMGVDRSSSKSSWFKQFRRRRSNVGTFIEDESTTLRISKQGIKSSVKDDEQTSVDEYLAFLDRRYQ